MSNLKLRVGADPEFSILWEGNRVVAEEIICSLFKDDERRTGHTLKTDGGEFGCDGCSATGELRPKADFDPAKVADNIGKCLAAFMEKGSNFELSTLSLWAPVGGHIHLELPEGMTEAKAQIAHKKLMSFYLPILLGEQKTNLRIRLGSYGKLTDMRAGDGKPTLEVRCPSAEWLTSRKISQATLAYMGVVWNEVVNHPDKLPSKLLLKTKEQEDALQEMALSDFEAVTRSMMRSITHAVKKFELYSAFKEEIDYILRPDRVLNDKKKLNFIINNGWDFKPKASKLIKKAFMAKSEIKDGKVEGNWLGVQHNGDINTGLFADELKMKILGGTKLSSNYYIFGLKKGIEKFIIYRKTGFLEAPEIFNDEEKNQLVDTVQRMVSRASAGVRETLAINFDKGKIERKTPELTIIGVPFDVRNKRNVKAFLNKIWLLENKKLQPFELKISSKKAPGGPSVLESGIEPTTAVSPRVDTDSQAARFSRDSISRLMESQRQEEAAAAVARYQAIIASFESQTTSEPITAIMNRLISDHYGNLHSAPRDWTTLFRTLAPRLTHGISTENDTGAPITGFLVAVDTDRTDSDRRILMIRDDLQGWRNSHQEMIPWLPPELKLYWVNNFIPQGTPPTMVIQHNTRYEFPRDASLEPLTVLMDSQRSHYPIIDIVNTRNINSSYLQATCAE